MRLWMKQTSRVALITGGSRGIGLGIARCLAAEGCEIVICGMRAEAAVADVVESLRMTGRDVLYLQADVSSREDRERLLAGIQGHYGRLNVLVNNAGVAPEDVSFRDKVLETEADLDGAASNEWVPRRPLPLSDAWFEADWGRFRRGEIYD